jgi:hypothetical protein
MMSASAPPFAYYAQDGTKIAGIQLKNLGTNVLVEFRPAIIVHEGISFLRTLMRRFEALFLPCMCFGGNLTVRATCCDGGDIVTGGRF